MRPHPLDYVCVEILDERVTYADLREAERQIGPWDERTVYFPSYAGCVATAALRIARRRIKAEKLRARRARARERRRWRVARFEGPLDGQDAQR